MNLTQVTATQGNVNLQEERPVLMFGLYVEEKDPITPPFYVKLLIHDFMLHNCMLETRGFSQSHAYNHHGVAWLTNH